MAHKNSITIGEGGWRARCSCPGSSFTVYEHHWQAEDELNAHLEQVARARAALGREPSLRHQAGYFHTKADDPATPSRERILWSALAEEIDRRLNVDGDTGTEPLW